MTVLSKNPNYFASSISDEGLDSINTKHIPRESLQIMEEIGEGAFGKVYKGKNTAVGSHDSSDGEALDT